MWPVVSAITRAFDLVMKPFAALHPWVGLAVISVATGVVMLLIFGRTSNQAKIAETKDTLKAYIMEMWIFRNDTRVMFSAIGRVAVNNVRYLRHSLRPLIFILIPVIIIMIQLGLRYEKEPLTPGAPCIVSVKLRDGAVPSETDIQLVGSWGARHISPPLRIDAAGLVEWELLPMLQGERVLYVTIGGVDVVTKSIMVGPDQIIRTLGEVRSSGGAWRTFMHPSEEPLPRDSIVESVSVRYPPRRLNFLGLRVHWLWGFFIISVAAGFALKGVFGIEV
jgi:hypothetical protein